MMIFMKIICFILFHNATKVIFLFLVVLTKEEGNSGHLGPFPSADPRGRFSTITGMVQGMTVWICTFVFSFSALATKYDRLF